MKKASLTALYNYLSEKNDDYMADIKAELEAELNKDAARKQASADIYAEVKPIVFGVLCDTPLTIGEIYDAIEDDLPDGFTKGKIQYAITRLWIDEVNKIEGKVNTYTAKAKA